MGPFHLFASRSRHMTGELRCLLFPSACWGILAVRALRFSSAAQERGGLHLRRLELLRAADGPFPCRLLSGPCQRSLATDSFQDFPAVFPFIDTHSDCLFIIQRWERAESPHSEDLVFGNSTPFLRAPGRGDGGSHRSDGLPPRRC